MGRKASTDDKSKLKMNQIMLLKRHARTSQHSLFLRMGAARYELPVETSFLAGDGVVFCQVKGGSSIFGLDDANKKFVALSQADTDAAYKKLLKSGSGKERGKGVQLDEQTQFLMRQLEAKLKSQGLKAAVDQKTGKLRAAKPRK